MRERQEVELREKRQHGTEVAAIFYSLIETAQKSFQAGSSRPGDPWVR
jgi:hypothetical protein